jgi:hypothetical protein
MSDRPSLRDDFRAWRSQDRKNKIPWVMNGPGERVAFTIFAALTTLVFLAWAIANIVSWLG